MGVIALIAVPVLLRLQWPNVRFILVAVFLLSALFHVFLGRAILRHEAWARTAGIVWCVLSLVSPIAILGGYALWCLTKGWGTADSPISGLAAVAG